MLRSWARALRQAVQSITRSGLMSLASLATVSVSLLVLAVVACLAVNLNLMAQELESQLEIRAFLRDGVDPAAQQALIEQVQALEGVRSVTFISKEEGLEIMRERLGEQRWILEGLEENPLPDSLQIELADPHQVVAVAEKVAAFPQVEKVRYGQGIAERLLAVTRAIRIAGLGMVLLLMVATVFTLANTIRLAVEARRREIAIMKLVGATDWFIRRPFVMAGILLGTMGAAVAAGLVYMGYRYLVRFLVTNLPFVPVASPAELMQPLGSGLLALGALLGMIGSWISLRRYLQV
ncbi:MAG: permease-like cell division protein FtsX [Bacillota bacterium]|nr:MAG: cell division protein FtsX [Bacillota bacterium]